LDEDKKTAWNHRLSFWLALLALSVEWSDDRGRVHEVRLQGAETIHRNSKDRASLLGARKNKGL
jgi:hypothetical protein